MEARSTFTELAAARHSCRRFSTQPVSEDTLQQLLHVASLAPASKGINSSSLIPVTDKEQITRLSSCKERGCSFIKNVPLVIAVTADPALSDVWTENASIAATYLLLEAQALGLGACWVQIRERKDADGTDSEAIVHRLLALSETTRILCLIAIGYSEN
ncbi:MAG: nitroreductase family protein [Bacteroidales bacterium]|nr:nitroreductase family protein [Candidatus Cryptobacteroides aphodequi]